MARDYSSGKKMIYILCRTKVMHYLQRDFNYLPEDLLCETNALYDRSVVSKAIPFDGRDHWMWSRYFEILIPPWGGSVYNVFVTFNIRIIKRFTDVFT